MPELSAAIHEGKDLSQWGKRRESACFAMTERAIRLADERALGRKPSPSHMVSLILLEGMHDQHNTSGLSRSGGSSGSSAYADGKARQRIHLDEAFAVRFLSQLDLAATGGKVLESRGLAFLGPPSTCINENKGYWGFVRVLRLTRCSLSLLLHGVVVRRIRSPVPSFKRSTLHGLDGIDEGETISGPEEDGPYWTRIERLHLEVAKRAFDSAREIVAMLKANLISGISLGVMPGAQHLFARLPNWIQIILDTPPTEEGGPPGFQYSEKLNDLRWVVKSLYSIGWSFERLSRPAPYIEREIQVLAERARLYHSVLGTKIDPEWALPLDDLEEVDIEALLASLTEGIL
ncbi:hypothetical protein RQP46_009590 [Phenoliferia psychrophenolica]